MLRNSSFSSQDMPASILSAGPQVWKYGGCSRNGIWCKKNTLGATGVPNIPTVPNVPKMTKNDPSVPKKPLSVHSDVVYQPVYKMSSVSKCTKKYQNSLGMMPTVLDSRHWSYPQCAKRNWCTKRTDCTKRAENQHEWSYCAKNHLVYQLVYQTSSVPKCTKCTKTR